MKQKPINDIIPKRSIREIPIPVRDGRQTTKLSMKDVKINNKEPEEIEREIEDLKIHNPYGNSGNTFSNISSRRRASSPRFLIWLLALGALIGVFVSISNIFSKAEISVTLKKYDISVDEKLLAKIDGQNLKYSTVSFELKDERIVNGTGLKEVSSKAEGIITIFNSTNSSQKLIANTRFEAPNGLIFRIGEAVTIPASKTNIPGSLDVKIIADKAGSEYNLGLTDFTIPGLKNDPRYNTIIARSKTPLSGGALGTVATISDEDFAKIKKELEETLTQKALSDANLNLPSNSFIPKGLYEISLSFDNPKPIADSKASIEATLNFKGYILNKNELAKVLSAEKIGLNPESNENKKITGNFEKLNFSKIETENGLSLEIKGSAKIFTDLTELDIKTMLKEKDKDEAQSIIASTWGIEKGKILLKPFWKNKIPSKEEKIDVFLD